VLLSLPSPQISAMFRKPGETTVSLPRKILAGLAAGAIGISVANVRRCWGAWWLPPGPQRRM